MVEYSGFFASGSTERNFRRFEAFGVQSSTRSGVSGYLRLLSELRPNDCHHKKGKQLIHNAIKTFAFCFAVMAASNLSADTIIIGGATGNGDFNAGGGGTNGGAQTYDATPNWFNAQGAETVNFTNSSQMGGSSDPDNGTTTRGALPFRDRTQINDSGYTIVEAGQVFSLSYDFGAGGGAANWEGLETMRTFIFTSTTGVDGDTIVGDMTELGGDNYAIDRAADGQWTSRDGSDFYTTTAADVGETVYFGMQFLDAGSGNDLFPRIDVVTLSVTDPVAVPEPGSLGVICLAGLGLMRRKRSL